MRSNDIEMSLHNNNNNNNVCIICLEQCIETMCTECCESHIYIHRKCKETFDSMYDYKQCIICRKKTLKPIVPEKSSCILLLCNMMTVILIFALFLLVVYLIHRIRFGKEDDTVDNSSYNMYAYSHCKPYMEYGHCGDLGDSSGDYYNVYDPY